MNIYYFAYGSNMSETRLYERNINPISKQNGILYGYEFIINKKSFKNPEIGFANIKYNVDKNVEGIVYKINIDDIKILDKYEGFPKHYIKTTLPIKINENKQIDCIVYIGNENWISDKELKTNKDYKNYILDGKEYLSSDYYNFLIENIKI